ncbi:MAG: hypothetical protein OEY01_10510 [Desulfobulbaceae bacterium]|nr:hypothetical protein [Desulfobulbaceae bacterium]HIJ79380.1 hypothetical protein [Deltaproteobacteria bacterium]
MLKFNLSIPHCLDSAKAKSVLQSNLEPVLQKKLGRDFTLIDESWLGLTAELSFLIKGHSLNVFLQVTPKEILLNGKIPLAALPFKKQLTRDLMEIGRTVLAADASA